jgi:hypothetical protein
VPPVNKNRSNYRLDTDGMRLAKGFGSDKFDIVTVRWDSTLG